MRNHCLRIAGLQSVLLLIIAGIIWGLGGRESFIPLTSSNGLYLVVFGTALLTQMRLIALPGIDGGSLLEVARDAALRSGLLSAALTAITLAPTAESSQFGRIAALSLSGIFWGVVLADFIIAPYRSVFQNPGIDASGCLRFIRRAAPALVALCFIPPIFLLIALYLHQ